MEAHIEQAVVLEEADVPVGLVTAIAGQTRATIQLNGRAGHAGTVPHDRRQDALAAAAELILKIEELGKNTTGLFATVGSVVANPGLSNVISGSAELRLDLRHENDEQRDAAYKKIEALISSVSLSRNLSGSVVTVQHSPAVPMDKQLSSHLESAISDAGFPLEKLVSGAGHDAMVMARLAPSCMLFVRCREGISHHPDEFVSKHDIRAALDVMVRGLIKFAKRKGK
jgi:allantoate deiminase